MPYIMKKILEFKWVNFNMEIINLYKCASNRIKVRDFSLTKLIKSYSIILKHCHSDAKIYYFSHENFTI